MNWILSYCFKATSILTLLTFCGLITVFSYLTFSYDVEGLAESSNPIRINLANANDTVLYLHLYLAAVALIIVPIQCLNVGRYQRLHRGTGIIYSIAVVVSGVSGLLLSFNAFGGTSSTLALGTLSVLWIYTTVKAVLYAVTVQLRLHKRWIYRSMALTLAAISLRLLAPLHYELFGLVLGQSVLYWSCWLLNGVIAEIVINRKYPV